MRGTSVSICLAILLATAPAAAQEIESTQLFPVVARTAGVGDSQWVSDLTVNNLLGEPVTVGIQFFPENQENTFDPSFPDRFQLGPRETRVIEDVLATVFDYTTNIKGALVITVEADFIPGNPEEAIIAAITRTYNTADPAGTYGQTVPSLEVFSVNTSPLIATGARNDATFRSNVGMVNLSVFSEVRVHYRVLAPDGGQLAVGVKTLPKVTIRQWSFEQLGIGTVDGAMTVELWLDEDSVSEDPCADFANELMGYVSKVDNGTGDAEFIYAAPIEEIFCPD